MPTLFKLVQKREAYFEEDILCPNVSAFVEKSSKALILILKLLNIIMNKKN
jgi:hypothetical protein